MRLHANVERNTQDCDDDVEAAASTSTGKSLEAWGKEFQFAPWSRRLVHPAKASTSLENSLRKSLLASGGKKRWT